MVLRVLRTLRRLELRLSVLPVPAVGVVGVVGIDGEGTVDGSARGRLAPLAVRAELGENMTMDTARRSGVTVFSESWRRRGDCLTCAIIDAASGFLAEAGVLGVATEDDDTGATGDDWLDWGFLPALGLLLLGESGERRPERLHFHSC